MKINIVNKLIAIICMVTIFLFDSTLTMAKSTKNEVLNINPSQAISVSGGKITGFLSKDKIVSIYKGIPYAAPPIGSFRWKAPQPVKAWNTIRKCTEFSASAIQNPQTPVSCWSKEFIIDTTKGYSEDCLYLNVWTQTKSEDKNRPVVVYIHGGANTSGGASCDVYDGEAISKKGVVYVSINYRVGIFGFLALPALSAENSDKVSGNYAILDQIAALTWVKNNISSFGGNPSNVTIVGQSSGSSNVHSLISSPMAAGLFKNAFAMSLNSINSKPITLAQKEEEGIRLFKDKTLDQMRAMNSEELLKLSAIFSAGTCIDGKVITGSTYSTYKNGTANKVNLITGMVDGDSLLFPILNAPKKAITKERYEQSVKEVFGTLAEECLAVYPAPDEDALDVFNHVNRDGAMALQYYLAKARELGSANKTYIYNFSHIMPGPEAAQMGAFHTADVPYWLNYFSPLREDYWTEIDYKLGDSMSNYFVNFAKTGNPNGKSLPIWNAYDGGNISFNVLGDKITTEKLSNDQTQLWKDYFGAKLGF